MRGRRDGLLRGSGGGEFLQRGELLSAEGVFTNQFEFLKEEWSECGAWNDNPGGMVTRTFDHACQIPETALSEQLALAGEWLVESSWGEVGVDVATGQRRELGGV